ncbi:MAG TPA: hypothetical protein VGF64_17065 [Acidimicrobiales bacterium]
MSWKLPPAPPPPPATTTAEPSDALQRTREGGMVRGIHVFTQELA